mgnify:CR=1 FL=1
MELSGKTRIAAIQAVTRAVRNAGCTYTAMAEAAVAAIAPFFANEREKAMETWTDDELWQIVNEFDDRTSPEDYPEMVMLNEAEFRDFLERGRTALQADNAAKDARIKELESQLEMSSECFECGSTLIMVCKPCDQHQLEVRKSDDDLPASQEASE